MDASAKGICDLGMGVVVEATVTETSVIGWMQAGPCTQIVL